MGHGIYTYKNIDHRFQEYNIRNNIHNAVHFIYIHLLQANMKTKWAVKKNNPKNTQEIHQPALMFNALHLKSSMLIVRVHERLLNMGGASEWSLCVCVCVWRGGGGVVLEN